MSSLLQDWLKEEDGMIRAISKADTRIEKTDLLGFIKLNFSKDKIIGQTYGRSGNQLICTDLTSKRSDDM